MEAAAQGFERLAGSLEGIVGGASVAGCLLRLSHQKLGLIAQHRSIHFFQALECEAAFGAGRGRMARAEADAGQKQVAQDSFARQERRVEEAGGGRAQTARLE